MPSPVEPLDPGYVILASVGAGIVFGVSTALTTSIVMNSEHILRKQMKDEGRNIG